MFVQINAIHHLYSILRWFSCFIFYYHCSTIPGFIINHKRIIKSCCIYCMIGLNTLTNKSHFCNTEELCLIHFLRTYNMDLFHPVATVVDCFTWKKDTKHNVTKLSRNTFLTYDVDIYGFHK